MRRIYNQEAILDLWFSGATSAAIAEKLDMPSAVAVMDLVRKFRRQGDPRAIRKIGGRKPRVFERNPPVPASALPDFSSLTPFGIMMGDPPAGRSALDRKRAGLPL